MATILFSCEKNKNDLKKETLLGKKINLMQYAITPYNVNSDTFVQRLNTPFKIITYANLYCEPCWQSAYQWKFHLDDFKEYPQVLLLFYVFASKSDFELKNKEVKLNFPILLDTNGRFRIVNRLGNNPDELTFLLNYKNEIIAVGRPFSSEIKKKYIDAIRENLDKR